MSLASVLRGKGHDVRIIDTRIGQDPVVAAREFSPNIVGISALTVEANSLHRIAREIKSLNEAIKIVAGGPHPTSFPEEVLTDKNIDCVVLGEAEVTLPELLEGWDGSLSPSVRGIAYREDEVVRITEPREPIEDINSLPFPAWDLVDIRGYFRRKSMASIGVRPYMNIFTSRGCPYRCIYCHNIFGKGFRPMSPEYVIEEIETVINMYGIRHYEVLDDVFNLDAKRAHRIYDLILGKGLKVGTSFSNGLRADRLEMDLLKKMKSAGVEHISLAVETASPRLQKMIKKNLDIGRVKDAISECRRLRIFTRGFFMMGFPTETEEELKETIRFAVESDLHSAIFFIVTPYKGTPLYDICQEEIKKRREDFTKYDCIDVAVNMSQVDDRMLFALQRKAFRLFYIDPWRIYHLLRAYPVPPLQLMRYGVEILAVWGLLPRRGRR